ncbi:possible pyrimidine permease in reductive pathway [Mesobacillus boroniphilus JCM 21738]|uniref:Possible pyrimidine permease in reductive pathway n=1 Tax=Mesobacillus boroniphilus JCM 21738 TaxID=1294265 RepID=W4RMJ5_9BACI|nr:possible pyrimidine permease in reductive pathway [Mesobacillus boroniphilus JCM 21738]
MSKKGSYLKSPDLLPISHGDRKISAFGFAVIWVGMAVVLAAFAIGGSGIQTLPLGWVIVATLVGSVAIGIFMTIIGDIGVEHGSRSRSICGRRSERSGLIFLH